MQSSSNDNSIWEYVHCSVCMVLFLPPTRPEPVPDIPFWLTECGHVVCNNHLKADQSCASCGTKSVSIVPLQRNMSAPLSQWFRPVSEGLEDLVTASRVQHNMLVSLVRHYRQRYDNAKVVVKQLQAELAALQGQLATRDYSRTPPRIPVVNQMPIHEHGYASTISSASKRRRIDMETDGHAAGSSPRSIVTPNRPERFVIPSGGNGERAGRNDNVANDIPYERHSRSHQLQVGAGDQHSGLRSLNAQQYAYKPPSTPLNNNPQITGHSGTRSHAQPTTSHLRSRPQSSVVMPPPALDSRRSGSTTLTSRTATTSFSTSAQGGTNVGQGGFAGRSTPMSAQVFQSRGGASSGMAGGFGARDGRRFVPGTPINPGSTDGQRTQFAAQRSRR